MSNAASASSTSAAAAAARDRLAALSPEKRAAVEALLRRQGVALGASASGPAPALTARPRDGDLPLSFDQQRVWFLHQLNPLGSAANLQLRTICEAPVEVLERALGELVARHEVLRTTYRMAEREPVQVVHAPGDVTLAVVDLSAVADDDVTAAALPLLNAERERPFDLARGPVWRAVGFRLARERSGLCMTIHHIATDGWSIDRLIAELRELCEAHQAGRAPLLPALPLQYADYAAWQREWLQGPVLAEQLAYWRQRLTGMPEALDLRPDLPRPAVHSGRGAALSVALPSSLCNGLRALAQQHRATLFMTLLALYKCLLARNTGQYDVVVGTPVAGRGRPELEHVQGLFLNSLVLRTDLACNPSFAEVLGRVRDTVSDAFTHQDLPFEKLVAALQPQRDLSRNPLFQALFTQPILDRYVTGVTRSPASEDPVALAEGQGEFDVGLWFEDYGGEATLSWHYGADLFLPATIERLAAQFMMLARAVVADPAARIEQIDLVGDAQRAQLALARRAAQVPLPTEPVSRRFEQQVRRTPQAVALQFGDETLSYAQLDARANRLARHLRSLGAGAGVRVAVHLERGIEMVVAVLAVLKSGAAYVPLDPAYPAQRLAYMLEDSGAALRLTSDHLLHAMVAGSARAISVDGDAQAIAAHDAGALVEAPALGDLAYMIYTSGSTGRPKGVMIEHLALANFLASMAVRPGCEAGDVLVAVTTLSFDIAGLELYLPLVTGARIVLASPAVAVDGAALARLLDASGATLLQATPATWRLLLAAGWTGRPTLKALCGGEALPRELAERLLERCGELWNMYGPTETTIWSAASRVVSGVGPVPIDGPIANTQLHVLDRHGQPAPTGALGELAIGGAGVARGYWQREALTAERFVHDALTTKRIVPDALCDLPAATPGARLYLTGDAVRRLADGRIEFIGRNDGQVKLRGFRIELGEVEAALERTAGVGQAVALLREDRPGDVRLVAYVVPAAGAGEHLTAQSLQESIARMLPAHMIPSAWVMLDAMPLTPNGKVDRKALSPPRAQAAAIAAGPPKAGLEQRIAAIWQQVLGVDHVGRHDNFFDLGGHSLGFVQVQNALHGALGVELPVVELFEHPTVEALARHLAPALAEITTRSSASTTTPTSTPAAIGPARGERLGSQRRARRQQPGNAAQGAGDVAVIGLQGRFPGAPDLQAFWTLLSEGREGIRFFDEAELLAEGHDQALVRHPDYVKAKGVAPDVDLFDAAFFGYSPADATAMDPQQRLFLEHAWAALEHAGIDPRRHAGPIGVYAATSLNSYSLQDALARGDGGHMFLNDKDYLATRTAYKLDLRGPCMTVQTACSSSLVALAEACESLLAQRCDVALAGGVSVGVPVLSGHLYMEGGVGSRDGHCRAFDAAASGCVSGDGVGVVVLKRLADALADGDTIHAVVKGAAVNNDGAAKAGFTAPSVSGQAEVIATALALAGATAASVGYVEAHGTGTVLGDPIEMAALTQAFRNGGHDVGHDGSKRAPHCAVGSLKTNIGHLDAAAGIAGFIKAVLCLTHRQLPPSLNFERPNPKIDFAHGPFYVNTALADWPAPEGHPRRAGVSSFGIGGTNAHVVLEEAPDLATDLAADLVTDLATETAPAKSPQGAQLLVLSARTAAALDAASERLAAHLRAEPRTDLAALAFTLQLGRRGFEHRRALVCCSVADAVQALAAHRGASIVAEPAANSVVFMFSGQGAQYAGMTAGLYRRFASFRDDIDACAEQLRGPLGLDLRTLLYPEDAMFCEAPFDKDKAQSQLTQTQFAQPALFAVEYALARLWMRWGVEPAAMIGHSIGEWAAACLAGVFTRDEALALVALRGRLMQAQPPGAMLAVPLGAEQAGAFCTGSLSVAADNAPALCVVAGPLDEIDDLQRRLAAAGHEGQRLHTSHAFHSSMMDAVVPVFTAAVARQRPKAPNRPFISNLSGTWITAEEATDPAYWGRHVRATVRFGAGLATVLEQPRVLLEVGPGNALCTFATVHPQHAQARAMVPSVRRPREARADDEVMLAALAPLWLAGHEIDWAAVHAPWAGRRIPLPTYPFEGQRHWIDTTGTPLPSRASGSHAAASQPLVKQAGTSRWTYRPTWRSTAPLRIGDDARFEGCWLVFAGPGLGARLATALAARGADVTCVQAAGLAPLPAGKHEMRTLDAADPAACRRLVQSVAKDPMQTLRVIHAWGAMPEADDSAALDLGFYSVLSLVQALAPHLGPVRIDVLTERTQAVTGAESLRPRWALVHGLARVVPQEYPGMVCRTIDIEQPSTDAGGSKDIGSGRTGADGPAQDAAREAMRDALLSTVLGELAADDEQPAAVALRHRRRWLPGFEAAVPAVPALAPASALTLAPASALAPAPTAGPSATRLRPHGVYLVTGGLGGVGAALAGHLARSVQARLVLVGRGAMPPAEDWAHWLANHATDDPTALRIRRIEALQAMGAEIMTASADVADERQMRALAAAVADRFGAVNGVIHAAGVLSGASIAPIERLGRAEGELQFAAKLHGLLQLQALFDSPALDFFMPVSSLSTQLGGIGFGAYAAANQFMDTLAHQAHHEGRTHWISLDWDAWRFDGVLAEGSTPGSLAALASNSLAALALTPNEGARLFGQALTLMPAPQIVVSTADLPRRIERLAESSRLASAEPETAISASPSFLSSSSPSAQHARPALPTAYKTPRSGTEATIASQWEAVLGIGGIGADDDFFALGGHSLMAIQLVARLRVALGAALTLDRFMALNTIAALAAHVEALQWAGSTAAPAPAEVDEARDEFLL